MAPPPLSQSHGAEGKGEEMVPVEGDDESSLATESGGVLPDNFPEIVASLPQPQGPQCSMFPSLRRYRGFWLPEYSLLSLPQVYAHFDLCPTDVLIASFPKCGTTWLKSLCFATARRRVHSPTDDSNHPLLRRNPHDCVRSIETLRFLQGGDDGEAPRFLGTHLPYSLLPERAKAEDGSGCRIVYVTRDPKDALVSLWHFNSGVETTADKQGSQPPRVAAAAGKFEEAFEQCCQGCYGLGPQWEHAREYWEASKRRPGNVLCLRYEEMLQDPAGNLRKIAAFMGCPFTEAEEEAGMVRAVLELCSMERQRNLAVNRSGAYVLKGVLRVSNKHLFRKGVVGDWRNHMTPEMASRLDGVVEEALKPSGFTFANATPPPS